MAAAQKFRKVCSLALVLIYTFKISSSADADLVLPIPPFEESFTRKPTFPDIFLENKGRIPSKRINFEKPVTDMQAKTLSTKAGGSITVCDSNSKMIRMVEEGNCSQYFISCAGISETFNASKPYNNKMLKYCTNGKLFDTIDLECVDKHEALCKPYVCQDNGYFPDPKNSARFIHCSKDGPKRLRCEPEGTIFNAEAKACLWHDAEEKSIILKLFKVLLWVVKVTDVSSQNSYAVHEKTTDIKEGYSTLDVFKLVFMAFAIPFMYITTVATLYYEINGWKRRSTSDSPNPYISDAEEFHRFYRRRETATRPSSAVGSRIELNNLYQTPTLSTLTSNRVDVGERNYNSMTTTRM